MGVYAVTGSASGMGAAVAERLRADGHRVIGVDRADADVVADLSTPDGRSAAAREVVTLAGNRLDGAVMAAGMGPTPGKIATVAQVNVLGVTDLLTTWLPALQATHGKAVVFGSNSSTTTPFVSRAATRRLVAGDVAGAVRILRRIPPLAPVTTYAASKVAVTQWVRTHATSPEWAGAGVCLNVICPGAVETPLLQGQLDGATGGHVRRFPIPIRRFGTASEIAEWVLLMLSPAADTMVGSVVTVDGGTDAWFRARDWPRPPRPRAVPRYLVRMATWQRQSRG
ncbi:MAG: SDR family oxidoreductase [Williamsia herbipolensis]|nr:SDR family oxidoreductase [Williamsia herbipolensis]